ncbi:DUF1963 domain-containing protein [Aureispira anguillae]|uniref:DUF1963 domain-containing protein n=1 Tax=Aureispira anguillae TaxID=2864201 RepID=A0A915YDZ9_9BACT|nr:DUF1963 domain-containing protein [Aureispira anguillae]BDS11372.1 DUF1963 domain-containing protein [Aureispira anguillae]
MKEFFKINNIDVGFANHPTEETFFTKGSLNTEVLIRKGKLRISLLTPALEITDEMHNGLLNDPYYDNLRHIDYFRMVTYYDLAIEKGAYNSQIACPYNTNLTGFETYNFPEAVEFHGIIDLQEGFVHIKGELKSRSNEKKPSIPVEALKCFVPKPLLPIRELYTWEQALKANPTDVYDLSIGEGDFQTFPSKLLEFKNLEKIWIGGAAQCNFTELPDPFYGLTNLHTIQIYQSKINTISEHINQLHQLEELTIESSNLSLLPDALCDLPALTTLNLKHNKLISLPKQIGALPKLRDLNIVGNNFKALPKSLANIYAVNADRKHRKLFMDLSYKSKNPTAIDSSLYDWSNYPAQKALLEKSILAIPELEEFKNLIVDYSTMATFLILNKEEKEIPIGRSKVGGSPDLPKNWVHPANKNGLLYLFHAQINCEEIAPFQKYLPRKGMLYFFVNDEEYAERPIVLYAADNQNLVPSIYTEDTAFIDSDFDCDFRTAVAVTFQNYLSLPNFYNAYYYGAERYPNYATFWDAPDNDEKIEQLEDYIEALKSSIDWSLGAEQGATATRTHSIHSSVFTQHESPQEQAANKFGGEPSEWLVLLNMESVDEFNFWDAGTLTYCIHKKDLAINDFSKISVSIESS